MEVILKAVNLDQAIILTEDVENFDVDLSKQAKTALEELKSLESTKSVEAVL